MNIVMSEEQAAFRDAAARFLQREAPLSAVRELYESPEGFDRSWWRTAAELGWTAMFVPEVHGGGSVSGRPVADAVIVAEEMGRLVSPGPFLPVNVVAGALAAGGTDATKDELLPGLASGERIASWAFGEEAALWDGSNLQTTIRADGSNVVISGSKKYVEAATVADHFLVTGVTDGALTQVIVPATIDGLTVRPARSVDMTRRFGTVELDDVRVPSESLVGGLGRADEAVTRQLEIALALQCAEMVGIADRVLEFTLEYAGNRYAFGRPIVSYQAIKHRVADLVVRLECSKAATDGLATALDDADPASRTLASVAKAYVAETCLSMVDECVQITGGIGVTWEHDLHLYNRRAAVDHAVYGTPEEHKRRIIASLREEAA